MELQTVTPTKLKTLYRSLSYTEGPAAYEVVGRGDFKRWAETIRFDVDDRFANFRDQANIELRSPFWAVRRQHRVPLQTNPRSGLKAYFKSGQNWMNR